MDAIDLSIFSSRIDAICEEMGVVLRRSAFSPNIVDRLDFSCAIFDAQGGLCAQAAHIPVHLGSMAYAMGQIVSRFTWKLGDMMVVNDPYKGGTHLPDVTLIAPLFVAGQLSAFIANRAHHADIGADSPGSMPISTCLDEEGIIISPTRLLKDGKLDETVMAELIGRIRNSAQARGDFTAQISANRMGVERLGALVTGMGVDAFQQALQALNDYSERLAMDAIKTIPAGEYSAIDYMDDDGLGTTNIPIHVNLKIRNGHVSVDFDGTATQVKGNINCPLSVTAAAVYYVFRCLMPDYTPACQGSFRPVTIRAPEGCLLNATYPAAVAAGNVETSTRIVDVLLAALAEALPEYIPAASHGSMNNLAMGSSDAHHGWDYYETIGGGMGASASGPGMSAVQTHMTNTLNTPVEVLEKHYPLRVKRYAIRQHSGGNGMHRGGNGLIREFEFLGPATVTLLTERRCNPPPGLSSGQVGKPGVNQLNAKILASKVSMDVDTGDCLTIETPGGGGWGKPFMLEKTQES
jgi:N-methylhydantoinase B